MFVLSRLTRMVPSLPVCVSRTVPQLRIPRPIIDPIDALTQHMSTLSIKTKKIKQQHATKLLCKIPSGVTPHIQESVIVPRETDEFRVQLGKIRACLDGQNLDRFQIYKHVLSDEARRRVLKLALAHHEHFLQARDFENLLTTIYEYGPKEDADLISMLVEEYCCIFLEDEVRTRLLSKTRDEENDVRFFDSLDAIVRLRYVYAPNFMRGDKKVADIVSCNIGSALKLYCETYYQDGNCNSKFVELLKDLFRETEGFPYLRKTVSELIDGAILRLCGHIVEKTKLEGDGYQTWSFEMVSRLHVAYLVTKRDTKAARNKQFEQFIEERWLHKLNETFLKPLQRILTFHDTFLGSIGEPKQPVLDCDQKMREWAKSIIKGLEKKYS